MLLPYGSFRSFGRLGCLYRWGLDVRLPTIQRRRRTLTVTWHGGARAYVSPDGTPRSATAWLWGSPAARRLA